MNIDEAILRGLVGLLAALPIIIAPFTLDAFSAHLKKKSKARYEAMLASQQA